MHKNKRPSLTFDRAQHRIQSRMLRRRHPLSRMRKSLFIQIREGRRERAICQNGCCRRLRSGALPSIITDLKQAQDISKAISTSSRAVADHMAEGNERGSSPILAYCKLGQIPTAPMNNRPQDRITQLRLCTVTIPLYATTTMRNLSAIKLRMEGKEYPSSESICRECCLRDTA